MSSIKIIPNAECTIRTFKRNNSTTQRLIQMGILPGSRLRILRVGPMGETLQILVDQGDSIALRADELKLLDCQDITVPLTAANLKHKQSYRIYSFWGGAAFKRRMKEYGLVVGETVEAKRVNGIQVWLKDGRTIALGWGESDKIMVELLEDK